MALVASMEAGIDVGYHSEVVTFLDAGRVSETYGFQELPEKKRMAASSLSLFIQ